MHQTSLNRACHTHTTGTCTNNHNALIAQRHIFQFAGGEKASQHSGACTLNVVIETRQLIFVTIKYSKGDVFGEVFPLNDRLGPFLFNCINKAIGKFQIGLASQTFMRVAQIVWIADQILAIGTHVQMHRHRMIWADTSTSGIQRQFADADRQTAVPLIANA